MHITKDFFYLLQGDHILRLRDGEQYLLEKTKLNMTLTRVVSDIVLSLITNSQEDGLNFFVTFVREDPSCRYGYENMTSSKTIHFVCSAYCMSHKILTSASLVYRESALLEDLERKYL